jgi:hypothetical protein
MSESISTPAQEVVVETVGTDTQSTTDKKTYQGRDRVGEAMQKATAEATPETMTVETLASLKGLDDGGHKGIDYNKVISQLPDDAQKLLANLRADYTRKTQELSAQRKELESMRDSLIEGSQGRIEEYANQDPVELDPYDTASFEKRIEQEVAKRLSEMMQPMREQRAIEQKRAQLQKFKDDNPDLGDYKDEIYSMLKANENMSLENAYYIVKGKAVAAENTRLKDELAARQQRMRDVGLKLSSGGVRESGNIKVPKHMKRAHEIYAYLAEQKGKK